MNLLQAFFQHFAIYTMSVVLRAAIECAFLLLQYRLFGFRVPELYKCRVSINNKGSLDSILFKVNPCPNTVDCYSSRPTEKTIFIHFMFGITLLSMFLNFTELIYLAWHWIARRHRKLRDRQRMAKLQEGNIIYFLNGLKIYVPNSIKQNQQSLYKLIYIVTPYDVHLVANYI